MSGGRRSGREKEVEKKKEVEERSLPEKADSKIWNQISVVARASRNK